MNDMVLNVNIKEDKSVGRLLKKTSKQIRRSIEKSNLVINEKKLLEAKTPLKKTLTATLNIISVVSIIILAFICFCSVVSRVQNIPPSFGGYSTMIVSSTSMQASGLNKGDSVVVKSVNTDSLKNGDIIAFYTHTDTFENLDIANFKLVQSERISNSEKRSITLSMFLGIQPKSIREASKANSKLVIHHIDEIYEDENGIRYFTTYGSSNTGKDSWYICEDLIVGKYDDSTLAKITTNILSVLNKPIVLFLLVLIPLLMLVLSLTKEFCVTIELIKLEREVLSGKRLLTDIICVKTGVGYNMSKKNKLRTLATAPENLKTTYVSLLWKDGTAPKSIRKHYLRKSILLGIYAEYNELGRSVALMCKDGVDDNIVADYYLKEKEKLEKKEKRYNKLLKKFKLIKHN